MKNDEYFMEINEDVTTVKYSACADAKGGNGGIVIMRHPFTISAGNYHKENLHNKTAVAHITENN